MSLTTKANHIPSLVCGMCIRRLRHADNADGICGRGWKEFSDYESNMSCIIAQNSLL